MTWVRRAADQPAAHTCEQPFVGDGRRGDLWRCDDCRRLWRIGLACSWCDAHGARPHAGQHMTGPEWRPATLWQRLRHRR